MTRVELIAKINATIANMSRDDLAECALRVQEVKDREANWRKLQA